MGLKRRLLMQWFAISLFGFMASEAQAAGKIQHVQPMHGAVKRSVTRMDAVIRRLDSLLKQYPRLAKGSPRAKRLYAAIKSTRSRAVTVRRLSQQSVKQKNANKLRATLAAANRANDALEKSLEMMAKAAAENLAKRAEQDATEQQAATAATQAAASGTAATRTNGKDLSDARRPPKSDTPAKRPKG